VPANTTHPDYIGALPGWLRARDVIAGEDAVKRGDIKYLPRLDAQSDNDYRGYKNRACFFNATSRTRDGFLGLLFRRDPEVKLPDARQVVGQQDGRAHLTPALSPERRGSVAGVAGHLRVFTDDVDLMGTSLFTFCKGVVGEVLALGRCGTLIDWQGPDESRAYVVRYEAEDILNWQTRRIHGRNVVSLIALREIVADGPNADDPFVEKLVETIRVLKLDLLEDGSTRYCVELWQVQPDAENRRKKPDWKLVETRIPLRLGRPLPLIPFVFHGPRNSLPDVDKMPLADIIFVNLDHYRLDADYKHGLHFTALPTPWVAGFDKTAELKIGSQTAWVSDSVGAVAGYLEFKGHGLSTFETAQAHDEQQMALLGSRMLEDTKRVGETADAIELRQAGENSILMTLALSVSDSISQVLRWVYWWNSTEPYPQDVGEDLVLLKINTDFTAKGLSPLELNAIVAAWQAGAISQETMFDLFRKGEVLPTGRTDAEEKRLLHPPSGQNQIGRENQTGVFPKAGTTPVASAPGQAPQPGALGVTRPT